MDEHLETSMCEEAGSRLIRIEQNAGRSTDQTGADGNSPGDEKSEDPLENGEVLDAASLVRKISSENEEMRAELNLLKARAKTVFTK